MYKSLQWKIVTIFFLLTLIAMEFVGIFLIKNLETYYKTSFEDTINAQASLLSWSIEPYMKEDTISSVEELARNFTGQSTDIKIIAILDKEGQLIANSRNLQDEGEELESYEYQNEVVMALSGQVGSRTEVDSRSGETFEHYAYPIEDSKTGDILGAVYLKASLQNTYEILNSIQHIIYNATAIAILLTVFLAFVLARTITKPIREVTAKAESLAKGDYEQKIEVKSKDEIGQLAEMFNHLTGRLKETLSEITNEKNKMQAVFDYMVDGVLAFNLKGELILYNQAAVKMLDMTEEDVRNVRELDFLNGELKESILEVLKGKSESHREAIMKKGENQFFKVTIESFKDENGDTTGIVAVLNDVTEQEKLQKMQKEFVANVSHELRTPLTVVRSYVETILEGDIDKETEGHFLKVVDSEATRMTSLVKDLLELSNLDYQETKWKKTIFDLGELMPLVQDKMRVEAKAKSQEFVVSWEEEPLWVFGDRERIEQVILNIISNAVKYTQEGGKIEVNAYEENSDIIVTVKDNGIGIPKEDLNRIFERFYRVDKARSREMGGTGLGLSIAKQIIEAHMGTIKIDSEGLGQGSIVTIMLPRENPL